MKKRMFLKKTVVVGSALMLSMATMTGHANVAKADPIVRAIQNHRVIPGLSISNGIAKCQIYAAAEGNASKMEGTLSLKKVEGNISSTVKSWSISSPSGTLQDTKSIGVKKGSYKLVATVRVYNGKKVETVTKTATATYR